MNPGGVVSLKPFVPAKDYEQSKSFFKDLGFQMNWESEDLCEFQIGEQCFLLQKYYVKEWADNFMIHLMVEDLAAWHEHLQQADLKRYAGVSWGSPEDKPWGLREFHLIDPSGVCWHFAQKPSANGTG